MSVRRKEGDILSIIAEGEEYFGRVLEEPFVAFYEHKAGDFTIDDVVERNIIFTIPVVNQAITRGRWSVIGRRPLSPQLRAPIPTFRQDDKSGKLYILIGNTEVPATPKECVGLERAAVWDPEHVEDRLRDARLGVENKWVKQLALKTS